MTNKSTKVVNLPHPNCEPFIALGIEEIGQILGSVLNITSGDSVGEIEGLKFATVPVRKALIIPGQRGAQSAVPCVLLKVNWKKKEEEKGEESIPVKSA